MVFINNWLAFTVSDTNPNKRSLKSLPSFVDLDNLVQATFVLTCEDIKELRDNILSVLDKVNGNEVKNSTNYIYQLLCLQVLMYTLAWLKPKEQKTIEMFCLGSQQIIGSVWISQSQ